MKYCVVLFFSCGVAFASEYPIVTSIQTTITSATTATYTGTIGVIDIGSAADVMLPANMYVGLAHRHDAFPGGRDVVHMPDPYSACGSSGCTVQTGIPIKIGIPAMRAHRKWGRSNFTIMHDGEGNGGECVGYMAATSYRGSPWGSAIMPPGTCVYAPPGQDWCKITTPQLTFDHGVIRLSDVAGHSRSAQLNINCTVGASVRLRLLSNDSYVDLQDGLRSEIFIEGKPLTANVKLNVGNNVFSMSDKLTGNINPGLFSGSSVLIMEPL